MRWEQTIGNLFNQQWIIIIIIFKLLFKNYIMLKMSSEARGKKYYSYKKKSV